ncbi:Wzz/FepE/Etk N-terminal domain-containing protein [Candidatus Pseudothioglobus singularis]|nr:Wzz/FepE/Etk N-terminal domain-containing protein [Candidatus Pseudothioglobus singularis]MDB4822428.1 Wzz/FepE/Etk N-terminal domain-containing protein [Candidatus Pseudothioglobus singularis]
MANDLNQSLYVENEIDLLEITKILIKSKKLIISTILIFTIASIIYSLSLKPSFLTSAKLEIGYFVMSNGEEELLESSSDLLSNLQILLIKNPNNKFSQNVSIKSIEDKIIQFETTSRSGEQNENILNEITNYIDARHSSLSALITNKKKDEISFKIQLIESELYFLKENIKSELESKISLLQVDLPVLDQEIKQLEQVIVADQNNLDLLKGTSFSLQRAAISPTLEQIISSYKSQINQLRRERNKINSDLDYLSQKLGAFKKNPSQSDEIFSLVQRQTILENQLQTLMAQTQVKTQPIVDIETNTIKPQTQLIIFLGIIFGFIASVFFVLIINFIKRLRESQA